MNKFRPSHNEQLLALVVYLLFKKDDSRDAFEIAKRIGLYRRFQDVDSQQEFCETEILKRWLELGCKVNFAWIENHGNLEGLVMSTYQLQELQLQNPKTVEDIRAARIRVQKRWSNDWKVIYPRVVAGESLQMVKAIPEVLNLTWNSRVSACARDLIQAGKKSEAETIQSMSLERLTSKQEV